MCPGSLDVCCKDPDFVKEKEDLTEPGYGGGLQDDEDFDDDGIPNHEDEDDDNDGIPDDVDDDIDDEDDDNDGVPDTEEKNQEQRTDEAGGGGYGGQPEKLTYQPQCGRRNHQGLGVRIQNYKDGK